MEIRILFPTTPNLMHKFADDVDLITTIDHYDEIEDELEHVGAWAEKNNLLLNLSKTREMIICKGRPVILPPPTVGIERVTSMKKYNTEQPINERSRRQTDDKKLQYDININIHKHKHTQKSWNARKSVATGPQLENTIQDRVRIACLVWNGK